MRKTKATAAPKPTKPAVKPNITTVSEGIAPDTEEKPTLIDLRRVEGKSTKERMMYIRSLNIKVARTAQGKSSVAFGAGGKMVKESEFSYMSQEHMMERVLPIMQACGLDVRTLQDLDKTTEKEVAVKVIVARYDKPDDEDVLEGKCLIKESSEVEHSYSAARSMAEKDILRQALGIRPIGGGQSITKMVGAKNGQQHTNRTTGFCNRLKRKANELCEGDTELANAALSRLCDRYSVKRLLDLPTRDQENNVLDFAKLAEQVERCI